MTNWEQRFKQASRRKSPSFAGEKINDDEPKWYDARAWKLGEWGSIASIVGLFIWGVEKFTKPPQLKTYTVNVPRKKR